MSSWSLLISSPIDMCPKLQHSFWLIQCNINSWQVRKFILFCLYKFRPVHGGVVSRELFHDYIMVWIEDTRLHLLDNCKAEKVIIMTHLHEK